MNQLSSAFVADSNLLAELELRSTPITLGSSRVLFREGEPPKGVFILRKGTAILSSGSNGGTVFTAEAGPGSLLGVPAVIGDKVYSLTAVALESAEISVISRADFIDLMREPSLAFQVLRVLAEEVRFAREALTHV